MMNHAQAKAVIEYLRPGVGYALNGDIFTADTMANVIWPSDRNDKPTFSEMEAAFSSAILAAGLKKAVKDIKQIRKQTLDGYVLSPGVSEVYNENLAAAKAHQGGQGATATLRDGSTATAYCTAKGSKMGLTADQFAGYIVAENQRVALLASQVEEEYLRVAYTYLPAQTDPAMIAQAVVDYQAYCDARKP